MKLLFQPFVTVLLLCVIAIPANAQTDAIKIIANGNVGIGNDAPTAKLHVGGPLNGTAMSTTFITNAGRLGNSVISELPLASIGFTSATNKVALGIRALRNVANADTGWGTTAIGLGMDVDNTIQVNGAGLWFSANGNIGIGKNTPLVKLEVAGDIKADGRIRDKTGYLMPVGSIIAYGGYSVPEGWLLCDGAAIDKKLDDLIKVIGAYTPDLRSRFIVGAGKGPGLSEYKPTNTGGVEKHVLTVAEMPAHNHAGFGENFDGWPFGNLNNTRNNMGSAGGKDYDNYFYNTSNTGGGQPHQNLPPYYALTYIIKY
jgi:microcystin-dependent protein